MKLHARLTTSLSLLALGAGLLIGCAQETPPVNETAKSEKQTPDQPGVAHDPHDVPLTDEEKEQLRQETATYAAAVQHIQSFRDTVRQETTEGEPAYAHRALDKLDLVLERLPEVAAESGVPRDQWETVTTASQQLRDLFNQVHANIDEGKTPDYEAVSDEIDQNVEKLAAIETEPANTKE